MTTETVLTGVQLPPTWNRSAVTLFPELEGRADVPWIRMYIWFAVGNDGVPGITQFLTDRPLSGGELRAVPWQRLVDRGVAEALLESFMAQKAWRYLPEGTTVEEMFDADHAEAAAAEIASGLSTEDAWKLADLEAPKAARRMRRRRNRVTDDLLAEVANVYKSEGPDAVAHRFQVGRRQADRYVATARERGLLQ